MDREEIARICEQEVLEPAARLFGTSRDRLAKFAEYDGCANLVYAYECGGQPRVLRVSYRPDRPVERIQAELHFVSYLAEGGVRVARPVPSVNGKLVEGIYAAGIWLVVLGILSVLARLIVFLFGGRSEAEVNLQIGSTTLEI